MRKLLIIAVLVAGCAGVPPQDLASDGSSRSPRDALSLTRAAERAGRVSNVRYELAIDLTRSDKYFAGTSTLHFTLEDNGHPLTVDFSGGEIDRLVVNSKPLAPDYNGAFLTLPAAALVSGANRLQIDYRHPYDGDGTGLHRFEDPEDGRTYLYTYLWPYYANRLLPAFDQPNLKAVFELSVRAPADWEVVSVSPGEITEREDGTATWVFSPTPRISTYVFSLHAGPYRI
ncbi:MAG: hypothetical protein R3200_17780, partial [Xanthomonadales bacterium]|nr:hypothetical protein [Xanthomonadales bacterium]